ncbi:TPA: hypothetical protein DEB00_03030 [Candidatus Uhrbacteria bacterium]|nr:hypothetical protein [Candidatus Uhrbacteria bacterium]
MINDIVLGGGIGALLALVLSIPAIVHEMRRRHHGHPLLIDIKEFGGKKLSDRESFALGLLFHLVLGLAFGALYPFNPGIWSWMGESYGFVSVMTYGAALYLFANVVAFPFMGLGPFGTKEDTWVWLETLVTMILLVVGYVVVVQWFQPSWFY